MRVCVIANSSAGSEGDGGLRDAIQARSDTTLVTPDEPGELPAVLAKVMEADYDVVAAAGGDGTVHMVANALMATGDSADSRPALAVLPLGTGNDFARTLALPLDPCDALALIDTGEQRVFEVLHITPLEGSTCYAMNVASGGFTGEIRKALTPERKERWGALAYAVAAAETIPNRTTYRVELCHDEGTPQSYTLHNLVVACGRSAGGGQQVAPSANPEDGLLEIVGVRAATTTELAGLAARTALGDFLGSDLVHTTRATRLQVDSNPPMEFAVDGEMKACTPVTFKVVPHALRVVVGNDYCAAPD